MLHLLQEKYIQCDKIYDQIIYLGIINKKGILYLDRYLDHIIDSPGTLNYSVF